jgi:catechol 2,3-dioxygenase-like lactoylglutathione lyase family enzyme
MTDTNMDIQSANIILYCQRWADTVAFYEAGLRLPILTRTDWFVEFELTKTARLSVADDAHTSIKSGGGKGITVGLQVTDITTVYNQLINMGLSPTPVKELWGAKVTYLFDPEGNRVEFWSGPAKS